MTQQPETADAPATVEFCMTLDEHVRAGYQCLTICTPEEARLESEITRVAKNMQYGIVTWDVAEGFNNPEAARDAKFKIPTNALREIVNEGGVFGKSNYIFVFRDLDDFYVDPTVRRLLRSLCEGNKLVNKRHKRPLIITSTSSKIHDKIKSCMTVVDFRLPGEEQLHKTLEFVKASIEGPDVKKAECAPELAEQIVTCLRGLTSSESENALARCLVKHSGFTPDMLATIKDEKASIIKKSEVLTYIPETAQRGRDAIGGFENFLSFVDRRRLAYSRKAREMKLDYPKGVVLLGVPGTGKSMVGKAACQLLGLPGYIMDVGSVFGSLVGESEQRMRDALRQVEAQQGCVLLLDEADKAFGGATDSQGDSGVTRRVFGQLLSWLSDKEDRTFVIMTLNRTKGIPPEFLRAGRFDAVFYTDLPNSREREDIMRIHFRIRGVDPDALDLGPAEWAQLVEDTKDFVGSELEELVREARYISYETRQSVVPTFEEMMQARAGIIPLARLDKEGVEEIRAFCKDRAKPVGLAEKGKRKTAVRDRSVDLRG